VTGGSDRYRGALWGFSSAAAVATFLAAPVAVLVRAAAAAAAGGPALQHLLCVPGLPPGALPPPPRLPDAADGAAGVTPAAAGCSGSSGAGGEGAWAPPLRWLLRVAAAPLKLESGTQTPTHFVEQRIVREYEWNEWALRRRVSRRCATHPGSQRVHWRCGCALGGDAPWAAQGVVVAAPRAPRGAFEDSRRCATPARRLLRARCAPPPRCCLLNRRAGRPPHPFSRAPLSPWPDHCARQPAHQGNALIPDRAQHLQGRGRDADVAAAPGGNADAARQGPGNAAARAVRGWAAGRTRWHAHEGGGLTPGSGPAAPVLTLWSQSRRPRAAAPVNGRR
jgi:hypothetical protein